MRKLELQELQGILLNVMVDFDAFCRKHHLVYYMIGGTALGAQRHEGFIPWDDDIDVGMPREDYERLLRLNEKIEGMYELSNYRNSHNCDYVLTRIYIPGTQIDNPIVRKTKLDKRLYFDIFPLDNIPADNAKRRKQKKDIIRLKRLLNYVDYREYNDNIMKRLVRYGLSCALMPFRNLILCSLEREMQHYNNEGYLCSLASQYSYEKQAFNKAVYGIPQEYKFQGYSFWGPAKMEEYLSQLYGSDYMELPPVEKRRKGHDVYVDDKCLTGQEPKSFAKYRNKEG